MSAPFTNYPAYLAKRALLSQEERETLDLLLRLKDSLESDFSNWIADSNISNAELGLHDNVDRSSISTLGSDFTKVDTPFLLALIYPPSSVVTFNDCYDNRTTKQILDPVLGRNSSSYIELLHFGVLDNSAISKKALKTISQNVDSFITKNYKKRIHAIVHIRYLLGINTVLWIGGPEAASAFIESYKFSCIEENYEIYSGNFNSAIVFGKYHPSASLSGHGDTDKLYKIQASLRLVKHVTNLLNAGKEVTRNSISEALLLSDHEHYEMVNANRRRMTSRFGEAGLTKILESKPSLLHFDLTSLEEILNKAENLCSCDKHQQALIAGKLIWGPEDVDIMNANGDEGFLQMYTQFGY